MAITSFVKFDEIKEYGRWDAEFFLKKNDILKKYKSFFKNERIKKFLDVVEITTPIRIHKGDLVFYNKGINFRVEIVDHSKSNSIGAFVFQIKDNSYSKHFLLWFFNQKEIQDYLSLFSRGNVIFGIYKNAFEKLDIITPKKIGNALTAVNITLKSDFKNIINFYYKEYHQNIKNGNYLSACFLAGAICEAILHEFLIDNGVKKNNIKGKMFGALLEIITIMNLNILNIDDFKKINNFRNYIHPQKAHNNFDNIDSIKKEIEPTFNRIIKNFGI